MWPAMCTRWPKLASQGPGWKVMASPEGSARAAPSTPSALHHAHQLCP